MVLSDIMNQQNATIPTAPSSTFKTSKKPFRLVLDEPVLFVEDKPAMVRGEVIANMPHETHIQGPIELVFEAIQIYYPWEEIMGDRSLVNPIQTKLQVIELSLLPPNSQGVIPAGIHRFPFEFPIPPTLPPTISIENRLSIFYKLTATLKKAQQQPHYSNLVDWAKRSVSKRKLIDVSYLRLVRAIEGTPPAPAFILPSSSSALSSSATSLLSSASSSPTSNQYQDLWSQYNGRLSIDEQHEQLVYSFGGRTADNLSKPLDDLIKEKGVRYKLNVDRTAIALGTSVGLEVILQPTQKKTKIKSIYLTLEESRQYKMKIPRQQHQDRPFETREYTENKKMLLKWAYAYPIPIDEDNVRNSYCFNYPYDGLQMVGETKKNQTILGSAYSHQIKHCKTLSQLDQPFSIQQQHSSSSSSDNNYNNVYTKRNNSTLLGKNDFATMISSISAFSTKEIITSSSSSSSSSPSEGKLLNLKVLDHPMELGEYFEGRFVLPVPPCGGLLHASMDHDNIKIQHWLRMVVVLEQDGRLFEIALSSPMHMLDCRLVSDDERQTILPPPPSYDNDHSNILQSDTFWAQRESITTMAQWGTCRRPCPCQIKQTQEREQQEKQLQLKQKMKYKNNNRSNNNIPHEFGAPPAYS